MIDDRSLHDLAEESWEVLNEANHPPFIFQRGQFLVDIMEDDDGRPLLRALKPAAFRGILDRQAAFMTETEKGIRPARPPNDMVADMMNISEIPLPVLTGIIECPIVAPDGQVVATPGYQTGTRRHGGQNNKPKLIPM